MGFLWVFFKYPKIYKNGNPLFFPVFRNKSIELVKQKHPLWPGSLVEDVARVVFETVAKEFMEETLLQMPETTGLPIRNKSSLNGQGGT